jgi:hypothetical protein
MFTIPPLHAIFLSRYTSISKGILAMEEKIRDILVGTPLLFFDRDEKGKSSLCFGLVQSVKAEYNFLIEEEVDINLEKRGDLFLSDLFEHLIPKLDSPIKPEHFHYIIVHDIRKRFLYEIT